ncbi:MAG: YkgJ family cysteine cluster protein [Treponema sp.]|nr:YkgJ family cysteine cluster protein [Treponema sp.]
MSQISTILEKLEGTSVYEVLVNIEESYEHISREQSFWYKASQFFCPPACGKCCERFEPDLFEAEALYMAAWLLENQPENAMKISEGKFPFDNDDKTCLFYNPDSPYHCSIYGGRAFICRLFGASSFRSRYGEKVWRPCKFYPEEMLKKHNPPLQKRQYSQEESEALFGTLPPLMSDLIEDSKTFSGRNSETQLIRDILPLMIKRILWLIDMNDNNNPNGSPSGAPLAA